MTLQAQIGILAVVVGAVLTVLSCAVWTLWADADATGHHLDALAEDVRRLTGRAGEGPDDV